MQHRILPLVVQLICLNFVFGQSSVDYSDNQYKITLLRASPGQLETLITDVRGHKSDGNEVIIMRHSQGDHWDLMLLEPAGEDPISRIHWNAAYRNDFLASSNWNWSAVKEAADEAGMFHIEMFHALEGMHDELLREREMENAYLESTGRQGNAIFVTTFGSDVDSFTIGFYPDMKTYATDPDLSDEAYHKAATDAGFKSRSDIGFYLRQFISRHHDTLASQVR